MVSAIRIAAIDSLIHHRLQIAKLQVVISQIAISQIVLNHNHCVLLMRCCDMRCHISVVGDSLSFSFKSASQYKQCDEFRIASSQLILCIGKTYYSLLAMRYSFRELKYKKFDKMFFGFLLRVPICLVLLLIPIKEGGLFVTTTCGNI